MKKITLFLYLFSIGLVTAQNVTFNDPTFKSILVNEPTINSNGDAEIQVSEASAYTGAIVVGNQGITDLTGIEFFTEITALQAQNNTLTFLDLNQNTKLTQLLIEGNSNLSGDLDLSMMSDLVDLKAHSTALTSINMANGNNLNVVRFEAQNSFVTCIQVDTGFDFYSPFFDWNTNPQTHFQYTSCTVSCTVAFPDPVVKQLLVNDPNVNTNGDGEIQCTEAQNFTGTLNLNATIDPNTGNYINQVTDLSGILNFTNATGITATNSLLTTVDLQGASSLVLLDFFRSTISSLSLTNCFSLQVLGLRQNELTALDLTTNASLITVDAESNQLTSFILPSNPTSLEVLRLGANPVNNIDFSPLTALRVVTLGASPNITDINLNANTNLSQVNVIDLPQLNEFSIANGNNSNIPAGNFVLIAVPNLSCVEVSDVAYAQANWTTIDASVSFSANCSVDITPPTALCSDITISLDNNGLANITPQDIDNGSFDDSGQVSLSIDLSSFNCSNLGPNTVTLTVTDAAGNSASCTATVTITDTIAPVVNADNLTLLADIGACEATNVMYTQNYGFTDNCGATSNTITFSIPEGSTFPVGDTIVTYSVTDTSGNTASVDFTVTVQDQQPPVISNCIPDITETVAQGSTFIVPDYTVSPDLVVNDNCGTFTLNQSVAPGTSLGVGIYTITMSATDSAGFVSTCDFELTVTEVLGIGQLEQGTISVFPNPTEGEIVINADFTIDKVTVFSTSGALLKTIKSSTFSIDDLSNGVYFLKVESKDQITVIARIVKM